MIGFAIVFAVLQIAWNPKNNKKKGLNNKGQSILKNKI